MAGIISYRDYRTINGQERYDQINHEDFKVDLKDFIDSKSNKIKFKLSAVKKLLPYNGFYPQQRTMQIAGIFNKVYLDNTGICTDQQRNSPCSSSYGDLSSGSQGLFATLAATQPLFSPGILFNTIKAGIAVDWPTFITGSGSMDKYIYSTSSYNGSSDISYYIKNINTRLPFETILDPSLYYNSELEFKSKSQSQDETVSIPYLDPTHLSYLQFYKIIEYYGKIPHITFDQIKLMGGAPYKNIYQSAINNFLYETVNFFLIDKTLCYFGSREFNKNEEIALDSNKEYRMDIVIRKNPNFSMFNPVGYSGSDQYIHSGSLFGPPHSSSHNLSSSYVHYTPPYFTDSGEDRISLVIQSASLSSTNTTISAILDTANISYAINKMSLKSCLNSKLLEIKDDKIRWYIQTKFETPLINFSKCSSVEVSQSNNVLKNYPSPS